MIAQPGSVERCDVAIIGAGPAGSIAALELARAGLDVVVIDKTEFPRFRIGESMLPHTQRLMEEMGLMDRVRAMPHMVKRGLEIEFGDGRREAAAIPFEAMLGDCLKETFNVRRSIFDQMLADAAAEAGARFRFGESVAGFDSLEQGDVRMRLAGGELHADWLIDASGQACVLARHLGTRRFLKGFRNVSYFQHFEGVRRNTGDRDAGDVPRGLVLDDSDRRRDDEHRRRRRRGALPVDPGSCRPTPGLVHRALPCGRGTNGRCDRSRSKSRGR